ncbi:MAG: hypothetical protein GY801_34980 [bacterium]|nr:hypothetical protein [bacterium]
MAEYALRFACLMPATRRMMMKHVALRDDLPFTMLITQSLDSSGQPFGLIRNNPLDTSRLIVNTLYPACPPDFLSHGYLPVPH